MSNGLDINGVHTNFYTLAHLPEIKYAVVKPATPDDQILCNVECHLRKHHPKLLATIHAKELHLFTMDSSDPPKPSPEFNITMTPIASFNPQKLFRTKTNTPTPQTTVLCVTFLKALKKLIILDLTMRKELMPFGNAALLPDMEILEIETKFTRSSQVGISISKRPKLLEPLSRLPTQQEDINANFALYLVPSGIRSYLVDSSIEKSITTKPSNYRIIVDSLSLLHNISINPETCTWVKLVPNLGHLNGMTSPINSFMTPVNNIKNFVWPLDLCLAQKAKQLSSPSLIRVPEPVDPLSLIDDFVSLKATSQIKTPSTAPTANNTPMTFDSHTLDHPSVKNETPQSVQSSMNILMEPSNSITPADHSLGDEANTQDHNNWDYINDELFGDGAENDVPQDTPAEDSDFDLFGEADLGDHERDRTMKDDDEVSIDVDQLLADDDLDDLALASELELLTGIEPKLNDLHSTDRAIVNSSEPLENEQFDVPIHEMTITISPSPYNDPGAPLPMQSPKGIRNKSIFSPLTFNPIIKSNIDDKYADGGKFFVKKNGSSQTVVPSMTLTDSFGKDQGDEDDDDDEEDDDDNEDLPGYDYEYQNADYGANDDGLETGIDNDISLRDSDGSPDDNGFGKLPNIVSRVASRQTSVPHTKPSENLPDSAEPDIKRLKLAGSSSNYSTPTPQPLVSEVTSPTDSLSNSMKDKDGVPNCLPFLLRAIPIYTIPENIFIDNPVVDSSEIEEIVGELLNQIVWNESYSVEDIPKTVSKTFNNRESVERSVAQIFPEIHETSLLEYTGLKIEDGATADNELLGLDVESPLSAFQAPIMSPDLSMCSTGLFPRTSASSSLNDDSDKKELSYVFPLRSPKMNVRRSSEELSVMSNSLYLWNLMSFKPLGPSKNFKILLITMPHLIEQSAYFLRSFVEIYETKLNLGRAGKLMGDSSEVLNNGLLPIAGNLEDGLIEAATHLKSALAGSSKDDNVLVLFPDSRNSLHATVSNIRLFQKFKKLLMSFTTNDSLNIVMKIIPGSFISNNGVFSTCSVNSLTRFSLNVYNSVGDFNSTFTKISTQLPEKIEFKMTKTPIAGDLLSKTSYIHLCYDRSTDKEWLVASWTDEISTFRKTKAWYCSNQFKYNSNVKTVEEVMNEIWDITLNYSSKLKGTKHLILTRLNGMIPDDELLHLKRLSSKTRDLTLIVVSVSPRSKLLLEADQVQFPINKVFKAENDKLLGARDSVPTVGSSSGLTPSMVTPQAVNSPDLFTINKNVFHDSPSSAELKALYDEQNSIIDICDTVYGVMIDSPETLINAPSRFSVKTGYLIKPLKNSHNILRSFEINLLSCPSNLQNDVLMRTLLTHFRNLSSISEHFGVSEINDSLVPWHVQAVNKAMHYLVHVRVRRSDA